MQTDATATPWSERLFIALQYILPHHLLSAMMWHFTRLRLGMITTGLIRLFVRHFRVDLNEAVTPDPAAYPTVNAFFTRALRPEVRPIASATHGIISPVDAVLSQFGHVTNNTIIQAKGHQFTVEALLGGAVADFNAGLFATLYLSPRDYHRIHTPAAGRLRFMRYVPGRLFSVNPLTVRHVPRLFARNERVICVFESENGPFILVLVGAIFVGSIATTWAGEVTPPRRGHSEQWDYAVLDAPQFERGSECARFNMGSTVILLLPQQAAAAHWRATLQAGNRVKCGELIGYWQ